MVPPAPSASSRQERAASAQPSLANTIGLVGAPRSGNENFFGIAADIRDSATVRLNVSNNIVRNTALNGIFIQTRDPSAVAGAIDADVTVRNNTVGPISDDDDFPFGAGPNQAETHAIRIESRNDSNLCLDLAGNSADGLGGNQDYLVRQRDTSTFNLERLTGNAADVTNIESFVVGQNPTPGWANGTGHCRDDVHRRRRWNLPEPGTTDLTFSEYMNRSERAVGMASTAVAGSRVYVATMIPLLGTRESTRSNVAEAWRRG